MKKKSLTASSYLNAAERSAIAEIEGTTNLLRLVTRLTGLRFAGIAKFTESEWVVCSTYDPTEFGIDPGDCVALETTICSEFRRDPQALFVTGTSGDGRFCTRPIVRRYAIETYAGAPIVLPDGTLFGALCALDTRPIIFEDPDLAETLVLFARLAGCIFFANLEHERVQADER